MSQGTAAARKITVVVPCYNEEDRLREEEFVRYLSRQDSAVRLLFVDDGSSDGTLQVLERIVKAAPPGRAALLPLTPNGGKAEAVRRGMLQALEQPTPAGDAVVGFWDCDLATPLEAIQELADVLQGQPWTQMVFGARVALLGRQVERKIMRHYLGRVFATLTSLVLSMPIYDTQCARHARARTPHAHRMHAPAVLPIWRDSTRHRLSPCRCALRRRCGAKLFRASDDLRTVLSRPFVTRWVFDVEMVGRHAARLRVGGWVGGRVGGLVGIWRGVGLRMVARCAPRVES